MGQRQDSDGAFAGDETSRPGATGWAMWHLDGYIAGLALLGAFLTARPCTAQGAGGRLDVRPHEMATGTRTARAGEQHLASPEDYLVYVPPSCVGTRRCPLVVLVPGGGAYARIIMDWHRPLADKYGMIVLAAEEHDVDHLDAAMQQVLQNYAIDPDKIALTGMSDGGSFAINLGCMNLDVFSRIAPISPGGSTAFLADPQNTTTQFFFAASPTEGGFDNMLSSATLLRGAGYLVKEELVLRGHSERLEDYDQMWEWLQTSWATPSPAARPASSADIDSGPLLTVEAIAQVTAFQENFRDNAADLVRTASRKRAYQKKTTVAVGQQRLLMRMLDTGILAAKYPPAAAALKRVGLTAPQYDAYRIALISAQATRSAIDNGLEEPVAETSVLGKNVAFLRAHLDLQIPDDNS